MSHTMIYRHIEKQRGSFYEDSLFSYIERRMAFSHLFRNKIGTERARTIAEALKVNPTLSSLDLWSNPIEYEDTFALKEAGFNYNQDKCI